MPPPRINPKDRFLPLGDTAITVMLGNSIDLATHRQVIGYCQALAQEKSRGGLPMVIEWVPAFCSVTVYFDPLHWAHDDLCAQLEKLLDVRHDVAGSGRLWRIPVLFGGEHGPDLLDVARHCNLTVEEIIERMTSRTFHVYMLGFMPGFPYMGDLPAELSVPRLTSPRKMVPGRSLAIAGSLCTVYPWQSPGGWRLVGRTPVNLFSLQEESQPALFAPGDQVQWQAISAAEFSAVSASSDSLPRSHFLA